VTREERAILDARLCDTLEEMNKDPERKYNYYLNAIPVYFDNTQSEDMKKKRKQSEN
jgi:hypothetical protein